MIGFGKGGIWDISHLSIFLPLLAVELVVASLTQGVSFVGQRIGSFLSFIPTLKTTVLGGIQFGASAREYLPHPDGIFDGSETTHRWALAFCNAIEFLLLGFAYVFYRSKLIGNTLWRKGDWMSIEMKGG